MNQEASQPAASTRITQAHLARLLGEVREKYSVPAVAVTVLGADAILSQEIQGVRVHGKPEPASLDDYFHIGSCSKSVLAVMAARLVEQHRLTWKTRFLDVLPELKGGANGAYHDISLEDLFLCEAGIKAYTNATKEPFPNYDGSVSDKRREFIWHLLAQPPAVERKGGAFRHLYSNASYTLASAMLEQVTGKRYEELVRETLTDDLGLAVHIGWPNSISPEQPWGHVCAQGEVEPFPPEHEYRIPFLITPAGDLSMTPKDYATYTQLHLRGLRGNDTYLTQASYRHIHFRHKGFSLGVANGVLGGRRFSGFDGSGGTFFCRSIMVPESDFAFTIMANAGSGTGSMDAIEWLTRRIVEQHFGWWWKFWRWW